MRKQIIPQSVQASSNPEPNWLDLGPLAQVEGYIRGGGTPHRVSTDTRHWTRLAGGRLWRAGDSPTV
jgi:hypothetical protein